MSDINDGVTHLQCPCVHHVLNLQASTLDTAFLFELTKSANQCARARTMMKQRTVVGTFASPCKFGKVISKSVKTDVRFP